MGWSIRLVDENGEVCQVPRHQQGSTINLAAQEQMPAEIDVTFNYKKLFNFRLLSGLPAWFSRRLLKAYIRFHKGQPIDDYWAATGGNVKQVLFLLFRWTSQHPDCVWQVY